MGEGFSETTADVPGPTVGCWLFHSSLIFKVDVYAHVSSFAGPYNVKMEYIRTPGHTTVTQANANVPDPKV